MNGLFIEVFREKMEELEYVKEVPEEGKYLIHRHHQFIIPLSYCRITKSTNDDGEMIMSRNHERYCQSAGCFRRSVYARPILHQSHQEGHSYLLPLLVRIIHDYLLLIGLASLTL